MKIKTIKIKLTQKQVLNIGPGADKSLNPYKRVFSIDSLTNATSVDTGNQVRYVGDVIEIGEAEFLCAADNTDVSVS